MTSRREARALGLIGGLGVGATIHYYRALVAAHAALDLIPRIYIAHADMQRVLSHVGAGDIDGLAVYLGGLIDRLADAGAEVAAVSAVAPHICAPVLAEIVELPLVDIIDCINDEIVAQGVSRVALLGAGASIRTALFGRLAVPAVSPTPDEVAFIEAAYARIAASGAAAPDDAAGLQRIAQRLHGEEGAERIVLAGTDLSVVFDEASAGFPALDSTRAHIAAIMRELAPAA